MMIKRAIDRQLLTAAVLSAAVCFMACQGFPPAGTSSHNKQAVDWQEQRLHFYKDSIYPRAVTNIESGDMITRLGTDITSEMLRQLNQQDQAFSHCGIASIENDSLFVYHIIGGEFNPDQKIKRETLYIFGHPSQNKGLGVFKTSANILQNKKIIQQAQTAFKNELKFDMQFDYQTDDRQYCAEFVAKTYSGAMGDSSWLAFTKNGNYVYVSVDNLFLSSFMREKIRFTY